MDQTKIPQSSGAMALETPRSGRFRIGRAFTLPEWMRGLLHNRKATIGIAMLSFFVLIAIFAPQIAPTRNAARIVAKGSMAPSMEYVLGTSRQGQDIFAQVVHGTRISMTVGFLTGIIITIIAILVGVTAGYIGGKLDDILSLITNVFLIIPGLPLIIVVAGWLDRPGPLTVVLVLSATSWAYGARVLRSQTLALRNSEFVAAARVVGEPTWRIVLFEILPNMTSLVASGLIGAVLYAILAEAGFEFIGLGDANAVTWGTTLYWAQNNQALLTGNWWAFVPPGLCIALVGFSLTLINYGIDEITNPRLRSNEGKA
ncbi:MAG: ABC transporter permease [Chloroflexota bacterium]